MPNLEMCMHVYANYTRMHEHISQEVSIPLTILINFHFLHHPRVLHCLKAIAKLRKVHAHLCAFARMHAYVAAEFCHVQMHVSPRTLVIN